MDLRTTKLNDVFDFLSQQGHCMKSLDFNEENIQQLFGHEAAEDEHPSRLKEYYFKTNVYDKVANNLSLRILVGHKGIGKSALFKIAMSCGGPGLSDSGGVRIKYPPGGLSDESQEVPRAVEAAGV